jgi:hypothetical protein
MAGTCRRVSCSRMVLRALRYPLVDAGPVGWGEKSRHERMGVRQGVGAQGVVLWLTGRCGDVVTGGQGLLDDLTAGGAVGSGDSEADDGSFPAHRLSSMWGHCRPRPATPSILHSGCPLLGGMSVRCGLRSLHPRICGVGAPRGEGGVMESTEPLPGGGKPCMN